MDVLEIRKQLHQIPELGRHEFKTKEYILNFVSGFDCEIFTPTPTCVILYFNLSKKNTICFRSDMDALPISEINDCDYKSLHTGVMHACAHDGHMAILLAFSRWVNDNKNILKNNIVCLFQPSEEDDAGARDVIKTNILDDLKIDRIFGLHIWPNLEEGYLYTMPKGMLATSGEVDIDIIGKSVHAANREQGIDALLISTKLITEFYDFCSKIKERHLISFGHMTSGTVRNAVAGNSHLEATMRAFDDETFKLMEDKLKDILKSLEDKYGCITKLKINAVYPSVINDEGLVDEYKDCLKLRILTKPFLQAEDFGNYTRKYKSMFMLLGCGDKHLLHTADFNFNMDILTVGVDAYIKIARHEF